MAEVYILLAAYNGSGFIREQVDSILSQSFSDFHLILSDDGSNDNTADLLEAFAQAHPDKITHYRSGQRFGCAQDHFMHLLQKFHDAAYIMFCDQDDVWHGDKIQKTLDKMRQTEPSPEIPTMVHTDLRVVDAALTCIHPSFMNYSGISGDRLHTKQLLVQNVVTGCTMMMNHALAALAAENTPKIAMHDWWIALLASACGKVGFLDEATIDYRQHGHNAVGAKNVRSFRYIRNKLTHNQLKARMMRSFCQAEDLLNCFANALPPEKTALLRSYATLKTANGLQRRLAYVKHGFWADGTLKKLGQLLLG